MKWRCDLKLALCVALRVVQGVLSFLFVYFCSFVYSNDAPTGFYTKTYIIYFMLSGICLFCEIFLITKLTNFRTILVYSISLCFLVILGCGFNIVYHVFDFAEPINSIVFWLKTVLLFCSACPIACINVLVRNVGISTILSIFTYLIFLLYEVCKLRRKQNEMIKNKSSLNGEQGVVSR